MVNRPLTSDTSLRAFELIVELFIVCFVWQRVPLVDPSSEIDLLAADAAERHRRRVFGVELLAADWAGENLHRGFSMLLGRAE